MKMKKKLLEELKHKTRRQSIKEGIFSASKSSFGDSYFSPFAIAINASNSLVALLTSVSGFLGPLSQLWGSRLMEKYSRKKIILRAFFFGALVWLPLIVIALLFYLGFFTISLPFLFLLFFSVYIIAMNVISPPWFSWMGDIVDEEYRGRWFSKRSLITGFVAIILTIIAAVFLDFFKDRNLVMIGFIILFSLALLSTAICWRICAKLYEPKLKLKKGDYFSFWDFLKKARQTNFGRFSIFRVFFAFASSISSALITIYLLRDLGFSYIIYVIIILSESFFSLVVMEFWGVFADKYGNYKVLWITALLIPLVPILWIFSPSPIYLIFVPNLISGISWAGFNLCEGNFIYDNVRPEKRGRVVSYYNLLQGIGVFFGAGVGAILIKYLTVSFIKPILLIFIVSGVLRMAVVFFWFPKIKEVRKVKKIGSSKNFRNFIIKQGPSTISQEFHQIVSIGKYLNEK